MKFKTILTTALLSTSSLTGNVEPHPHTHILETQKQLSETLTSHQVKREKKSESWEQPPQNKIDKISSLETTFSVSASDLHKTPFDPAKPMQQVQINATNMLWAGQAETILKKYNSFKAQQNSFKQQLESWITIPLIYPELKTIFPATLSELKTSPAFQKILEKHNYKLDKPHIILIIKTENGKNALAYYAEDKLTMATYTSLGTRNHKTIKGEFWLRHDNIFRKSMKYKAPMPYAIQIKDGYFMHQGTSDGTPRSHGCIRVPGLYQKWLYEQLQNKTSKIIIHNPYEITTL